MSTGGAYSRNGGSGGRKRSRIRVPGGRPTPTRCGNRAERPKMERALFDFRRKPGSFGRGDRGIHGELFSGGRRTGKGEWKKWHQTGRKKKFSKSCTSIVHSASSKSLETVLWKWGLISNFVSGLQKDGECFLMKVCESQVFIYVPEADRKVVFFSFSFADLFLFV